MVYNSVDNPKMCQICCQYTTSGLSHWVRVTNCHLKQTSCQFGPCTACCIQGLKSSFKDQTFLVQQTFRAWLFFNTLQKGQASLKCLLNLYKSYLTLYRYFKPCYCYFCKATTFVGFVLQELYGRLACNSKPLYQQPSLYHYCEK